MIKIEHEVRKWNNRIKEKLWMNLQCTEMDLDTDIVVAFIIGHWVKVIIFQLSWKTKTFPGHSVYVCHWNHLILIHGFVYRRRRLFWEIRLQHIHQNSLWEIFSEPCLMTLNTMPGLERRNFYKWYCENLFPMSLFVKLKLSASTFSH
jgi:hypothetical protein